MSILSTLRNIVQTKASSNTLSTPIKVVATASALIVLYKLLKSKKKEKIGNNEKSGKKKSSKSRGMKHLKKLLTYLLSQSRGRFRLLFITILAIVKTSLSDQIAQVNGKLFSAVFMHNGSKFMKLVTKLALLDLAFSGLNSTLTYMQESTGLIWRDVLEKRLESTYFHRMTYYRMSFVDKQVTQPESRIVNDLPKFASMSSEVSMSLIKGIIDGTYFTTRLSQELGPWWAASGWIYVGIAVFIVQSFAPNFGKLMVKKSQLESDFRTSLNHLTTHCEAVAAYDGDEREHDISSSRFGAIIKHVEYLRRVQWTSGMLQDFMYKYLGATVMAVIIVGPFFSSRLRAEGSVESTSQMLAKMRYVASCIFSQMIAIGGLAGVLVRLMYASGYANRLGTLLQVSKELYDRHNPHSEHHRRILNGKYIAFDNVEVITPTGNSLVKGVTFEVQPGTNLLITGVNGAGKSSLFRCLGGLWDIKTGTITKPMCEAEEEGLCGDVFYLPQKPYNVIGNLREQLVYPKTERDGMKVDDKILTELLELVDLSHLLDRKDDAINWEDTLSIGETQRLAMARLFFHNPTYAILDECTSGVPSSMEDKLYRECMKRNITCITISHRPVLEQYHSVKLSLDGKGSYTVGRIDQSQTTEMKQERLLELKSEYKTSKESDFEKTENERAMLSPFELARYSPDRSFGGRFNRLMKRLVPSIFHPAGIRLGLLGGVVVSRVILSNKIAHLNGRTVSFLINNDIPGFRNLIGESIVQSAASAFLAPSLMFLSHSLAVDWRNRLTKHLLLLYMSNKAYYKTLQVHKSVSHPEHRIAEDVDELTKELANLFPDVFKPILDIAWYTYVTQRLLGWKNTASLYLYMVLGLGFLRMITPNFAALTEKTQDLEGTLRYVHSRLVTHAESVAFFGGDEREGEIIHEKYRALWKHLMNSTRLSAVYSVFDDFVVNRLPHLVTWGLSYIYSGYNLLKGSEDVRQHGGALGHDLRYVASAVSHTFLAFGELLELNKRLQQLAGYMSRYFELEELLLAVKMASEEENKRTKLKRLNDEQVGNFANDSIAFDNVDIVTPDGKMLVKSLSLKIPHGSNLLITGFTGAGKSSIFRVLSDLWPIHDGQVSTPENALFFVPQRPYNVLGCLADLITYPFDAKKELRKPGCEEKLVELLNVVQVGYLLEREGGWTATTNWANVLSLGEQQRIGMARLFYHRPKFAVLDQCTDAVSVNVEEELYTFAKSLGITIITICQRPALMHLHDQVLQLTDGKGSWTLHRIHHND